jgi:hypothetical protein
MTDAVAYAIRSAAGVWLSPREQAGKPALHIPQDDCAHEPAHPAEIERRVQPGDRNYYVEDRP